MSIIVTVSGGKASAYCASWAFKHFSKEDVVLYFNGTKWEHPDLYRFINDLEKFFNHSIVKDSDGRSPEDVFYDRYFLANNRVPLCSRILKAERLQNYYKDGDTLVFGIDSLEEHRATRLVQVYQVIAAKKNKYCKLRFPLIENKVSQNKIDAFINSMGIKIPMMYNLGFTHNNCSGGCVRAGKKQWKLLLDTMPEVYAERERVEEEFREFIGKDVHFLKDETLKHYRERIKV